MEIAYVGPVPPLTGGISQHGARLARALETAGHSVTVHSWAAQFPRALYKGPIHDPVAPSFPRARFGLRWWDPVGWWRTGRQIRAADLLVFPWVTPFVAPAYRALHATARLPAVAVVHNLFPHERRPGDLALARWVLTRARGAVLHDPTARGTLTAWGIPTVVVPHPPNLDVRATPLPPGPPYRLLFFGHVRPYKGLDIALDAVARSRARGLSVQLTVAGHFWDPVPAWDRRIDAAGLGDVVTLRPGYVPDAEVGELFSAHHAVLAPYRTATQSGIVPLARAAGRPVAVTAVGGIADSVTEGVDGALAARPDGREFALAIERVIDGLTSYEPGPTATWTDVANAIVELSR